MKGLLILPLIALLAFAGCKNKQKATAKSVDSVEATNDGKKEIASASIEAEAVEATPAPREDKPQVDISKYEPKIPDNLFFGFKRTPCFGQCPVYELKVTTDGHAILEGKQHFDLGGYYQTQFTEDHINRIIAMARKYGFFEMDHVYDAPVTDLPSTTTILRTDTELHWTYNRMNSPDELREFEQEIETFIKDLQWYPYKPEKSE